MNQYHFQYLENDHFDFVPHIWGTSIKVRSLYVIILMVGFLFTVVDALIDLKYIAT